MAGKTERRMALNCGRKSPGWPDCFSTSHETSKKNRNVENKDIGYLELGISPGFSHPCYVRIGTPDFFVLHFVDCIPLNPARVSLRSRSEITLTFARFS